MSWKSFFLAVLAGVVITLLTRMQHSTDSMGVKIVPAILFSFVLVGASLFHSVLDSILMFAGLLAGDPAYGWATGSVRWGGPARSPLVFEPCHRPTQCCRRKPP